MRFWRWILFGVLSSLIAISVISAGGVSNTSYDPYNSDWNGVSKMRSTLESSGTQTYILLDDNSYRDVPANGTAVLILSPKAQYSAEDARNIGSYVRRGGTVIVAADFGIQANQLLEQLDLQSRFDGRLLRDEQYDYRSSAVLVAENVSDRTIPVGQVTFNHGTAIDPNGATVLVSASGFSFLDTNRNGVADPSEPIGSHPVVTREQLGEGTVIMIGDPSIFINSMLERSGNRVFVKTFLTRYDRLVFDYSHTDGLPPQTVVLLTVRGSESVQSVLGVAALLVVLVSGGMLRSGEFGNLVERVSLRRHDRPSDEPFTRDTMREWIEERNFEADGRRAEHIAGWIALRLPRLSDDD